MDLDKVQVGLRIKTNAVLGKTTGMLIAARHLRARRPSTEGVIDGFVPGMVEMSGSYGMGQNLVHIAMMSLS